MPDTPASPTPPNPVADWPRPLAFVLSGGGAFGSVQIGMIRALLERDVRPDLIVGTSAGALHGAVLADRPDDCVDALSQLWSRADRQSVFGGRINSISSMVRNRTLSDGRRLGALIDASLRATEFGQLGTPFAAVATDAVTGEPELLCDGALRPALLASAAVPGLLPAVEIDGRRYVDGGVSANVPIRQAIAFGAASVISLDATPSVVATTAPRSFSGGLLHSASLMLRNQRSHAVDEIAHRYRIGVLPSPTPSDMGSFNFTRTAELLESSYALTIDVLDAWSHDAALGDQDPTQRS
ncbi:patatin-like phospholipase family protein [Ilumatobacter nonamiensis]|uniref:patatin-like phospholipase family protein n=1 Tax=Ilumatobacter nonamiensis TaxID=467093 RepID=UPI000349FE8B|nr:patatin-like phospholipase family protein [Ilumatobacter nonamiensis]